MKIAILGNQFINWGGGIDFLKYYISALQTQECELLLLIPIKDTSFDGMIKNTQKRIKNFAKKVLKRGIIDSIDINSVVENFLSEFAELDYILYDKNKLARVCKENNVDIIFPCHECLSFDDIPWIGYVYDFQHKYLTEFFTKESQNERNAFFADMLSKPKAVVTNSYDTKKDCYKYYPDTNVRVYVTPFAPIPRKGWLDDNSGLIKKYGIDYKYIIICNQLWQHKGHLYAIEAFDKLIHVPDYSEFKMIFTGALEDGRNPNYIIEIKKRIRDLHLEDKIVFMGYLPKLEQIELIKHSELVVQPTMFEGGPGGGAAYDAISVGKQIVLSDLEVNKEINDELAIFFKCGDSNDLFLKIMFALKNSIHPNKSIELESKGQNYRVLLGKYIIDMLTSEINQQKRK